MNKTTPVIILCSLAVGYFAGTWRNAPAPQEITQTDTNTGSRAPRFGETKKQLSASPETTGLSSAASKGSIDALLLKGSRMTPTQIEEELNELVKNNLLGGHSEPDLKKVMAAVYLSYKWGQAAPKQALLQSKSMGMMGMLTTPLIIQGWAETNPEAAAAYYDENKKTLQQSKHALKTIAAEMAKTSPEAAMKWISSLDEEERSLAIPSFINGIADTHPEQLAANINKLSAEDLKNTTLCSEIAGKWAQTNWAETTKWINSLPESQQKAVRERALGSLSAVDLDTATKEFKQLGKEEQTSASRTIANNLSMKGGTEALDWVVKNASENDALRSIPSAIGFSSLTGGPEVKDYISKMPSGLLRDTAAKDFLEKAGMFSYSNITDHESNMALASSIGDEKKKEAGVNSVMSSWSREQPEKAKVWINQSSLTPEKKQEYLKRCEESIKRKTGNN